MGFRTVEEMITNWDKIYFEVNYDLLDPINFDELMKLEEEAYRIIKSNNPNLFELINGYFAVDYVGSVDDII